ncbi:P-loop containing nucleoside triphosphate hydrolase protein [Coprinopsis marcescibilis]|uniref:P-loop containing nucleoside triphosphate hydrolase protein n=1 Tax=Coprinopsis marcescibilis TaxID=230819 RepID=A0A5C3L820_COPMA|nr:P-loop containing nucleoside triphosphate hydrolase protein [Coprinopsis marcescibilis]
MNAAPASAPGAMSLPGISGIFSNTLTRIMGFSFVASLFNRVEEPQGYLLDKYSITAQFTEGDPTYEWIVMFLTEENIWKRSRDFRINAKSSARRWGIKFGGEKERSAGGDHVDLVPTYELPHLFRWKGFWIETKRNTGVMMQPPFSGFSPGAITLTIYSLEVKVLQDFIEEARVRYIEHGRSSVILHSASQPNFGPGFVWNSVKRKLRRPLDSIILEEGVIESIVKDAKDFIEMEDWYIEAGIPHRRGYLLHGPPGTGKTSTIHALAGELGMEIFSLSLSAGFVDDAFLQQAASSIPKKAIFLIEDIDSPGYLGLQLMPLRRSSVTLSGLLNVIDGIGSEEGVLFFATTNHIDRLDPALLRPGRIDRKVQYNLTTARGAQALFSRFFPPSRTQLKGEPRSEKAKTHEEFRVARLGQLALEFSKCIPENEFTTAELQGYLLSCKTCPEDAVLGSSEWVGQELKERRERKTESDKKKGVSRLHGGLGTSGPEIGVGAGQPGDLPDVVAPGPPLATTPSLHGSASSVGVNPVIMTPPSTPPLGAKEPAKFAQLTL